jgi:histidinol-phosphate/aromatic aminotransferase/cobyric acid decarboxylase-like protein
MELVVIDEAYIDFQKTKLLNELDEYPIYYYSNLVKSVWFSWNSFRDLLHLQLYFGLNKIKPPYNVNELPKRALEV